MPDILEQNLAVHKLEKAHDSHRHLNTNGHVKESGTAHALQQLQKCGMQCNANANQNNCYSELAEAQRSSSPIWGKS
jgi:hypothetical protein